MAKKTTWYEKEFELWFRRHSDLPNGEPLLVFMVSRERGKPGRIVDILALDHEARLVLIEVKNEKSGRTAMGQAMEYLSQYADATVADLEMERTTKESVSTAFARKFGTPLEEVSDERRVFLVAPEFDYQAGAAAQYFSDRMAGVTFRLMTTAREKTRSGFELDDYGLTYTSSRELLGKFGVTAKRVLIHVLGDDSGYALWRIGKMYEGANHVAVFKKQVRPLEAVNRFLLPHDEEMRGVELSDTGRVVQLRDDPAKRARVLGKVWECPHCQSGKSRVMGAQFDGEKYLGVKPLKGYDKKWVDSLGDIPGWRELATMKPA